MTNYKLKLISLVTGLLISLNAQAALINLSFTGNNNTGASVEALFVIDSNDITAPSAGSPFLGGPTTPLSFAQFTVAGSAPITFNDPSSYFGADINGETYEFRAINSVADTLRLTFTFNSSFSYDPLTNNATLSALGYDSTYTWGAQNYTGNNFTLDLSTVFATIFYGNASVGSLNTSFVIDTLNVSVSAVPVPAAVWLFASGLIGLFGFARKKSV